jgi:hypothetical protein
MIAAADIVGALGAGLSLGLPVFPVRADKRPACPGGFLAARDEPAAIRELWRLRYRCVHLDSNHPEAVAW